MQLDDVRVHGESGPPVLLLPGGAESCDGFFPGLREGLTATAQVVEHDRPGTGTSAAEGSLAGAAAALSSVIERLDRGPVVVVGQSLGGAVGVLLARDHPEQVAGLVLLDPTPINDPRLCATTERMTVVLGRLAAVPGVRRLVASAFRSAALRTARGLRPDCAAAAERTANLDIAVLARAVRGLTALSRDLRESDLPRLPAVVVTADRKPGHAVRRAHERLAAALGGEIRSWPGATHGVHLDHPDEVLATVRELVGRVAAAS
ncbi:alpha/beta hydrolase [Lentzea sp. HUAS12]|uniref:alpha/beta hydrolase n=1 Tax=Lentzea sp. HUAS12 TaxID=2951806 RepID=UPI00209EBAE9|nr:alpha/beta hydrolase [Lentzea sp. HUAS12]USX53559.1 alpha/beta hydrolase [Lentzea sp. HUAS12]